MNEKVLDPLIYTYKGIDGETANVYGDQIEMYFELH